MNIVKTAVLAAYLCMSYSAHGQQITKAAHLAPEDFGAHKWILRGTASTNEVVIFRRTRTTTRGTRVEKHVDDAVEIPPSTAGGTYEETILYYDANFFNKDTTEERWRYKGLGGVGGVAGRLQSWDSHGKIVFRDEYGPGALQTIVYEVLVMPYSRAKEIHPDLPAMEPNRGWSGNIKSKDVPAQEEEPKTANKAIDSDKK